MTELTPLQKAIEPCPFCGGEAKLIGDRISVKHLGVFCPLKANVLYDFQLTSWNTRSAAKQLEALQTDNEALISERDDLKERFPTTAQIMVYHSLLKKYKALQKENEALTAALGELNNECQNHVEHIEPYKLALKKCAEALNNQVVTEHLIKCPDCIQALHFNLSDNHGFKLNLCAEHLHLVVLAVSSKQKALSDPLVKQVVEELSPNQKVQSNAA